MNPLQCKLSTKPKEISDLKESTGLTINNNYKKKVYLDRASTPSQIRRQRTKISLLNSQDIESSNTNIIPKQKRSQTPKTMNLRSINEDDHKLINRYDCLIEEMLSKCFEKKQQDNLKMINKKTSKGNIFYLNALSKKTNNAYSKIN